MEPAKKQNPEIEADIHPNFGLANDTGSSASSDTGSALQSDEQSVGANQGGVQNGNVDTLEQDAGVKKSGLYVQTSQGQDENQSQQKQTSFAGRFLNKKYAGITGILSGMGIFGLILAVFFGSSSMLISVFENVADTNDSTSQAMNSRFMNIFRNMTKETDPVCANSKTVKCKMGRISNSALTKLEAKGIKPQFAPDTTNTGKRTGYPSKNPTRYIIDMGGGVFERVDANDLPKFLLDNPKIAGKVLGASGAFNLKYRAWVGKYIVNKLYKKMGINRNGGLADGNNERTSSATERARAASEKLQSKIPGLDGIEQAADSVKEKISPQLNRAKKGGATYTAAVAGCIGVKAPSYIAAAVAAIQLRQLLPLYMDTVGSPASYAKASGVEEGIEFTSEDMDTIGTVLTEETENKDGEMTSALDSAFLLAAMGVNKGRTGVSKDFAPGFAILSSPAIIKAQEASKKSEQACNAVLSPAALNTATAANATFTVLASSTVVLGIVKVAASWAVSKLAAKAVEKLVEAKAEDVIREFAENDKLPTARGEELGDALGVAATSFYASGAMAQHVPVLKESQIESYEQTRRDNAQVERQIALASLSPFDTSSRYTFLGSISYNLRNAALLHNGSGTKITSMVSSLLSLPSFMLGSNASAFDSSMKDYCSNAGEFGLTTDNPKDTPAITSSGLPCTGLTKDQAAIGSDTAINLMEKEEWIDKNAEVEDGATIEDLVEQGIIKDDSSLKDLIIDCSNPDTGDYIYNAAGCTVDTDSKSSDNIDANPCVKQDGEDGENICASESGEYGGVENVKDNRSPIAAAPFLLDYQISQKINGEDEEEGAEAVADPTENTDSITLATYNIRHEENFDTCSSPSNCEQRGQRQADIIEGKNRQAGNLPFDIIAMQEISPTQQERFDRILPNYDIYPASVPKDQGVAIMWNNTKLTKTGEGTLSLYDNVAKKADRPWVKLSTSSGTNMYVISNHSPHGTYDPSGEIREQNATALRDWALDKSSTGDLAVIMGDFNRDLNNNTEPRDKGHYCIITSSAKIQNAYDMANSKDPSKACPTTEGMGIDHIYVSTNDTVTAENWSSVNEPLSASDHPVRYVTLKLPGSSAASGDVTWPTDKSKFEANQSDFFNPHGGAGTFTTPNTDGVSADISLADGTPIYAMVGGKVTKQPLGRSSYTCGDRTPHNGGLMVESQIQGGTLQIAYAHGYDTAALGSTVTAGQQIMKAGSVGNSCGSHLHIDMSFNGKNICPQHVFRALSNNEAIDFTSLVARGVAPCQG